MWERNPAKADYACIKFLKIAFFFFFIIIIIPRFASGNGNGISLQNVLKSVFQTASPSQSKRAGDAAKEWSRFQETHGVPPAMQQEANPSASVRLKDVCEAANTADMDYKRKLVCVCVCACQRLQLIVHCDPNSCEKQKRTKRFSDFTPVTSLNQYHFATLGFFLVLFCFFLYETLHLVERLKWICSKMRTWK